MTKEQGEKKTPIQMPPEIEALRLAALSTRNPKKEKKLELPIAETTLETAQQALKSTTADDDEVFSEREEGELTDTDEQMGEASHTSTSEDIPICMKQEGNEQWRIQDSSGEPYLNSEILDREAQESTTRELIKELYSMGASAIDIYAIGVPLDVIIRFSNELNIELPKDLIQTQQILSEAGTSSFMLSSSQNPVFGQNTFSTQIFPNSTNVQNTPLIQNIPSLQPLAPNAQFLAPVNSVVRDQPNMMFAADSTLPVQSSSSIMFSGSQQDQISALFQGQYSNISSSSPSSSQNVQNMLNIQQTPALLVLQNSQQTALSTNPQWETPALGLIIPTDTNIMSNNNATHQMMASSIDTKATEQSLQASSMSPHFMNTTSTGATPPILATTNIDEQSSLGMECDVCTEDVPPQGSHVSIPSKGKNKAVELNNTISQMSSIALINHSSSQNRANTTKPFSSKQVNNFIIDLSDESDGEQPVSDLAQQTKTAYKDSEEMQINAKQKLKEKEMEIRRMNELIASKMEMLKKKNATSVSTSSDTKANSIFNINDHEELQQSASQNQINNNVGTLKESRNDVTTTFMTEVSFENNQESTLTNETELEEINSNIKKATNDLESTCNEINKTDLTLQDCGQQYPDIGTKLDDFRTSREELENRRKALQEELEEVERKLINNSTKMQEVEYERGRVEGIENQRALLLQNRKNADEVLKTLMDKVDKSTKPNQEETVKSSSKSVDKNANGKRNVPTEIMSPETLLKKTKLSSSVPSEEMDQLRQRLENVSREHQEIRQNIVTLSTRKVGATPNPSDYTTTTLAEMDPVPEGISAHSVGKIHIVDGGDTVDENVYAVTSATTDHLSETSTSNINNNAAINNSTSRAYEKHTPVVWSDSDDNLASEADEDPFESYRSIRLCKNSKQKSHSLTYSNKIHPDRKLCMFETQRRGRCNDDQCLSQHFRDLPLNDHELVQDLLSYYEGCTDEQKIEYREGLKSLYDKMKEEKWDVNTCIDAMIDYRTEFNARHRSDYLDPLKHVPRRIVFNKKRPLSDPLDCEDDRASTSEEEYSSESLPTPEIITTMDDQEGYTPFEQSSPEYGMEYEEQINYLDPVSVEPHEHIFPEYDDNSEAEKDDPGKFDVPPSPSEHDSDVGEDEAYEELQQGSEESHVEQPQEVTALENKQENTPSNSEPQETPQPSSGFNVFKAIYRFFH